MKKRLQVVFSDEAWGLVENLTTEANHNFDVGSINYSDVINEMILTSRVDVKKLQVRHTDIRRSLRSMASKESVDLDLVIKSLMELKASQAKKKATTPNEELAE